MFALNCIMKISGFLLLFVAQAKSQNNLSRRMDSLFNTITTSDEPGGAVLIAKENTILFSKGYGIADINTKQAITTHTIFNTGSISKTFVSNAILILQQQHKLSIEDNLLLHFPDFKNKAIAEKVQIKHLLSHVSGLPDCREVDKNATFYLTANDIQNFAPLQKTDTLVFEPGNKFEYSNPAFNGLALIIEKVSGMKWQNFVRTQIFKKASMKESDITDGAHPESGVAHGYEKKDGKYIELDYGEEPTFCAAGNGGIWSSVHDLFNYYKALQKPSFLNAAIIKNSMKAKEFAAWKDTLKPFIGYSWFITKTLDGQQRIGHTGSQGGFTANFQFVPEKKIFITLLFNTPQQVGLIMKKIEFILKEERLL
jgi:CubicO group peptidase (beta-lactamase class C family)